MARQVMHIGDFGVEHDDIQDLEFGYFGSTIRVHPDAGELTYMDFMAKAIEIDQDNEAEGVKVTMDFLKEQIHPDDWELFWKLAMRNRQKLEDLMAISRAIVEHTTGFPTGQPSGSSATPTKTEAKSKAVSSSRDTTRGRRRAIERGPSVDSVNSKEATLKAAYEELGGRPDLQAAIIRANEADASVA